MRSLTQEEIDILRSNGCWADDWSHVTVADGFVPRMVQCSTFIGHVSLGSMEGFVEVEGLGAVSPAIRRSTLCDVTVGDRFYISAVDMLSGYTIGDNFVAFSCGRIFAPADGSSFGIGTRVSVVNEGGGREVALSAHLTSNIAYSVAMHGYKTGIVEGYEALVEKEKRTTSAVIGNNVSIYGASLIDHVRIGDKTIINGASELRNGTILSDFKQVTKIGVNVEAKNFVFAEGARVQGGAKLKNVFVGQCAEVGQGFFGENLLVFANSQLLCGEGVSVLAGPFTVSHHKTTLLIAGAYSFFNAGSATNASNHHYRLGPVHQAIYERGCKTASGSYVLEPAHVGAFTMIVGAHKKHPDTTEFPFSILAEREGDSSLLVAQNMKTIGIFRDSQKWKKRDKRVLKSDAISCDVLNPITVSQMIAAVRKIEGEMLASNADTILYNGTRIRKALLPRAVKTYRTAIDSYLAKAYLHDQGQSESLNCQWVDCGGLVMPDYELQRIEEGIINGAYDTVLSLADDYRAVEHNNKDAVRCWAVGQARSFYGYSDTQDDLMDAAQRVAEACRDLRDSLTADAEHEWMVKLRVGYGLDGTDADQVDDYLRIHGTLDQNQDVQECQRYYDETW